MNGSTLILVFLLLIGFFVFILTSREWWAKAQILDRMIKTKSDIYVYSIQELIEIEKRKIWLSYLELLIGKKNYICFVIKNSIEKNSST